MDHDERDGLWQLLGKAKQPTSSPFFSRNVLRALREQEHEKETAFTWLARHWRSAAAVACGLALIGGLATQWAEPADEIELLAEEVSASPDYAVISQLDELLASEESSVWLDNVY